MKPFKPHSLPIQGINWERHIPLIGAANRSLARYDGAVYGVPNPEVLLSPLTTREAVISSKIEGTQATLGDVLKFDAGDEPDQESRRQDIHEIINYRRALHHAADALSTRPFNLNLLLDLHNILLDSVRGRGKARGRFRTVQNWIGAPLCTIEEAEFVPPEPEGLLEHLTAWENYYHADRPDPLVQLAVIHAQFEIIHPFIDGNGRLGRILVPLFLYEKRLLARPMFYVSEYLEEHRDEYVETLRGIGRTADSWDLWIEFFLRAIDEQAKANAEKARAIMALYIDLKNRVIQATRSQFAVPLLDQLFHQPLFQPSQLRFPGENSPSRPLIFKLVRQLKECGILHVVREGRGRRAHVLALRELVNLAEGKEVF
jgi:Fic family protein